MPSLPALPFIARRRKHSNTATAYGFRTADRSLRCARRCRPGFPGVAEIITLIGSHNLLAPPRRTEFDDPALRHFIARHLRGAEDDGPPARARTFPVRRGFLET